MPRSAAKKDDLIIGLDTHVVMVTAPGGPVPTLMQFPFSGPISERLSDRVRVQGKPVAVAGSKARNSPGHIPIGGVFQKPPTNEATVAAGSARVLAQGEPVARVSDSARCCNDPCDSVTGHVVGGGRVLAG